LDRTIPQTRKKTEKEMKKKDKSWSVEKEGHLNKNNIIFKDKKYKELYLDLKKVNDMLKEKK